MNSTNPDLADFHSTLYLSIDLYKLAAWVNLQPAEYLLFRYQLCSSAQAQAWEGTGVKPAPKSSLDMRSKFYQDPCRGMDFH